MQKLFCSILLLLLPAVGLFAAPAIVNFGQAPVVSAVVPLSESLIALGTNAGLSLYNTGSNIHEMIGSPAPLPDPFIKAMVQDTAGVLWIGTDKGNLVSRTSRGTVKAYSAFSSADSAEGILKKISRPSTRPGSTFCNRLLFL